MAGKTLSNGTLSLRFMQNAHRAKLQAQVEAEQAKIRDDAEWSVAPEVRQAWGIGPSTSASTDAEHETSYLPFIFQSDLGEGSSDAQVGNGIQFRGRRTFNARGKEVIAEEPKPKEEEPGAEPEEELKSISNRSSVDEKPRSRFEKRPTSISGFRKPNDGKKSRTKTAQMLIREDPPIRPPASSLDDPADSIPISRPAGFVKPAGVDEPVSLPRKRDRDQDPGVGRSGADGSKKKKRKGTETSS